jgi:D-amino-acid dehydrogenase
VVTERGELEADAFVLCAGIASNVLACNLGESLPIYPIKGYSLTLSYRKGQKQPVASVTDLSRKMVLAPLGDRLRVAAVAELAGDDLRVPTERLNQMQSAIEAIYPGLCDFDQVSAWAGLRPSTPDSLPIIRPSRVPNVILNVGHGALGFTLAAGSAKLVAGILAPDSLDQHLEQDQKGKAGQGKANAELHRYVPAPRKLLKEEGLDGCPSVCRE